MSSCHVLLAAAEDDRRTLLEAALCAAGHQVTAVRDGLEALTIVFTAPPDLLVAQSQLPNLDGMSLCWLIKSQPSSAGLPVVLFDLEEDGCAGPLSCGCGADAFLSGTGLLDALVDTVKRFAPAPHPDRPAPVATDEKMLVLRLADLLELQSQEARTWRQIAGLSCSLQDLEASADAMLAGIGKLASCRVAALAIADEDESLVVFRVNRPVTSNYLQHVKNLVIEALPDGIRGWADPRTTPCVVNMELGAMAGQEADQVAGFHAVPLGAATHALGAMAMSVQPGQDDLAKIKRILGAASPHVFVAMDNARLKRKVDRLSIVDPLTRLHNRRHFDDQIEREVLRAARNGSPLAVVLADIDRFKQCNDSIGHQGGDLVLRGVAQVIRSTVRHSDLVARFGGEEFVALLPDTDFVPAQTCAERIRAQVASTPISVQGREISVTVSVGVARYPQGASDNAEALLTRAQAALTCAQDAGGNLARVA